MKTILIDYQTLRDNYFPLFKEPRETEIYFKEIEKGWILQFHKNGFYIKAIITQDDLLKEAQQQVYNPDMLKNYNGEVEGKDNNNSNSLTKEDKEELLKGKIASFEVLFLQKSIKVKDFEGE